MIAEGLTYDELLDLFCERTGMERADAILLGDLCTGAIAIILRQSDPEKVARLVANSIPHVVQAKLARRAN